MRKYQAPTKEFFRLPNNIFTIPMTPIEFRLYAYLVCCIGSKGYCWPSIERIAQKIGTGKPSVQEHLKTLQQRHLIAKAKHTTASGHRNNVYTLLSQDNPGIYRDLTPPQELPLSIFDELPA